MQNKDALDNVTLYSLNQPIAKFRENAVGVLSPGQGSQYPGMGEELYESSDEAKSVFYEASEATGVDIAEVCFGSQSHRLEETLVAQPAIAAVSIAEYYRLKKLGLRTDVGLGHSMGEVPLLAMAGALSIKDTFGLLQKRASSTAKASEARPGIMAAVTGLTVEEAKQRLGHILEGGRAAMANMNGVRQQVFSGDYDLIEELESLIGHIRATERIKVGFRKLKTGGAFHSRYHMEDAVQEFYDAATALKFKNPEFEIMLNNAQYLQETGISNLPSYLSQQLISGVDFTGGVDRLVNDGVTNFIEAGPGGGSNPKLKILSSLIKRDFEDRVQIIEISEAGQSA